MRWRTNRTMTQPIRIRTAYCQPEGWTGVAERLSVLEAIVHLRRTREFNKGFGSEIRNLILASSRANSYFWPGPSNIGGIMRRPLGGSDGFAERLRRSCRRQSVALGLLSGGNGNLDGCAAQAGQEGQQGCRGIRLPRGLFGQ